MNPFTYANMRRTGTVMAAETKKKAPGNEVSVIPSTFSLLLTTTTWWNKKERESSAGVAKPAKQ